MKDATRSLSVSLRTHALSLGSRARSTYPTHSSRVHYLGLQQPLTMCELLKGLTRRTWPTNDKAGCARTYSIQWLHCFEIPPMTQQSAFAMQQNNIQLVSTPGWPIFLLPSLL